MAKVLLVEPDRYLANNIQMALRHFGHTVKACHTAQSAIHQTDVNRPDVIILELQLPVHNGIEFLYELRSYYDWQQLPVIVYSQVPPTLKAISSMLWRQLHIAAYHYKPFTKLAELAASVDNVLVSA